MSDNRVRVTLPDLPRRVLEAIAIAEGMTFAGLINHLVMESYLFSPKVSNWVKLHGLQYLYEKSLSKVVIQQISDVFASEGIELTDDLKQKISEALRGQESTEYTPTFPDTFMEK